MDGPQRAIPQFTSRQVLGRFVLRLALLATFANFGNQGFVVTFSTLLALAALFCSAKPCLVPNSPTGMRRR
jgi:hypothetical protein